MVYNTNSNRIEDLDSHLRVSDEVDVSQITSVIPVHRALVKFLDFDGPMTDTEEELDGPAREDDKYVEDSIHGVGVTIPCLRWFTERSSSLTYPLFDFLNRTASPFPANR